jgi:RNA polymerase sigma-70 factor (ECF subfamily)
VLALSAWEGLDHGQIAVVLGCSRNAVRIRMHRARRRLAARLPDGTARLSGGPARPAPAARPASAAVPAPDTWTRDTWKEDLT